MTRVEASHQGRVPRRAFNVRDRVRIDLRGPSAVAPLSHERVSEAANALYHALLPHLAASPSARDELVLVCAGELYDLLLLLCTLLLPRAAREREVEDLRRF